MAEKLVSIVGASYFQPIADLVDKILESPYRANASVQATPHENGYSNALVLLLVATLESYTCRLRYVKKDRGQPTEQRAATKIIKEYYPKFASHDELVEIYILRDAIFHNHVWEIDFDWSKEPGMSFVGAQIDPHYGDKKFSDYVNIKTRQTKNLSLNVVPVRVDRTDVIKVFEMIWGALMTFEAEERIICYVSHLSVRFRGDHILFSELGRHLQASVAP